MSTFKARLLRLKEQLGVPFDGQVAALLGLEANAFCARKRRRSFPIDRLRALAQRRPDLRLDVEYILTGLRAAERTELFGIALDLIEHRLRKASEKPRFRWRDGQMVPGNAAAEAWVASQVMP